MFFNYPSDKRTFDLEDQFMIGDAILVKGVTDENQHIITILLPGTEVIPPVLYNYRYCICLMCRIGLISTPIKVLVRVCMNYRLVKIGFRCLERPVK